MSSQMADFLRVQDNNLQESDELASLRVRVRELEDMLAKEELRHARAQFEGAFDHAAIGMALVSIEGRWIKVNNALCNIVGYSEPELMALTFQDITHPEDLDTDLRYVEQMLKGDIDTYQMDKRYFHKNGDTVLVQLNVSLVRDSARTPVHFVSQIQDITDARADAARIEKLNRELSQLLDTFTHDLHEPIRKVGVHAMRMRESIEHRQPERAMKSLEIVKGEVSRMGALYDGINQLLQLSTQPLRMERVELNGILEMLAHRLSPRLKMLDADLQIDPLPELTGDRRMLETLFRQLLDNSLKFKRPDAQQQIHVFAEVANTEKLVVCVEDRGIGIEPGHEESAFRLFHRLQADGRDGDPGIGLPVCRKIAELHGGHISVRSNTNQPGVTMVVELPTKQQSN